MIYTGLPPIAASLRASPYWAYGSQTVITEVDVHDPSAMAVTQTMSVDGRFVDARQSGASARIVISSAPHAIAEPQLAGAAAGWVPSWRFKDVRSGRHFTRQVASCGTIRRPVQFSGLGMVNIVTVNFNKGLQAAQSTSLMADAQIVYGSPTSLYIATQKWVAPTLSLGQLPASQVTVIDKFDVSDPDTTTYLASGEVPGYLLNQFSLSESGGFLRVASTSRPIWWGPVVPTTSQSYVTVLQPQGGVLAPVGQVSGLGQGEQIYSVRFVGNTGYVVTFHQVDPLYTIDLSTPTAPKVVGELELQGYSAYLHPLTDGLLLGIGQDVSTSTNEPTGAQLELFDVADPSSPKLLAKTSLGTGSSSQATYDHHAFLYWAGDQPRRPARAGLLLPGGHAGRSGDVPHTAVHGRLRLPGDALGDPAARAARAGPGQRLGAADRARDRRGEPPLHGVDRGGHGLGPRHAGAAGVRLVPRLSPSRGPTRIRERGRMAVLRVPDVANNEFREYYRQLISESVRHSSEESREPPHLRSSVRLVWIAAVALLVVDLLAFGVHSWTTSAADIALIVATLVWFWVCVDDLIE